MACQHKNRFQVKSVNKERNACFGNKITAIRNELVTHPSYHMQSNEEEQYVQCAKFISFQDVTEHEIKHFIDKVDKKTCELDRVPACSSFKCVALLLLDL